MTYCLAIALNEGLVFCSDSRTNAGADRVSTYSKMHRFECANDRQLVLLTAGNLATSQAVVSQMHRDADNQTEGNYTKAHYVSEVANYIGKLSLAEQSNTPIPVEHRMPALTLRRPLFWGGKLAITRPNFI